MGMLRLLGEAESGLHTHPEADITDGSLLARLAADETISGQWDFLASLRLASQLTVGAIAAPAASASLDLVATDKALILNRLTTTQRDALTAVDGMLIYNSTTAAFEGRKAGSWVSLTGGGGGDHNILSATHLDTVAAAVARGDLMVGQGVTPTWQRLPLGAAAQVLRSNGADALWATLAHADLGSVTADQHHAQAHAAQHAENAGDELLVEGLGTASLVANRVPKSDGLGGLAMGQVGHGELSGVTADQHHAQAHAAAQHNAAVLPGGNNEDLGAAFLDVDQIATPANPAVGTRRIFVDSADGRLKVRTSGGSSVSLEEQGGGVTFGPPTGDIDIGDAAGEGISSDATRADHQHAFAAPIAGYPVDVAATEADGTATTPARSDHRHAHGSGYLPDAHHTQDHAARHAENAADELLVEGLGTATLTANRVPKSDGLGGLAMGQVGHGELSGVTADQHHPQSHAIGGADHTGFITDAQHGARGPIVNAHAHGDLAGIGANDHHAQAHALDGADHSGTITDAQHGARGPIVNAHGHGDLAGVTANQHHAEAHDQGSTAIHTGLALSADTISEKTAGAGVTVDSAKIKDGVAPYRLLATFTSEKGVDLAVTTGTHRFPVIGETGATFTIKAVRAMVGTAPTGAAIIVDVNKNGTTIFTTQGNRPTIAAGASDSGKVTNMDVTSIAEGDYLGVDIDQVGSTTAGRDLTVVIEYEVTL